MYYLQLYENGFWPGANSILKYIYLENEIKKIHRRVHIDLVVDIYKYLLICI